MVTVSYGDLLLAFEFVSSAPSMENGAYVSLDTGEILWTSDLDAIDNEVPDDIETSDRYIVPVGKPGNPRPARLWGKLAK